MKKVIIALVALFCISVNPAFSQNTNVDESKMTETFVISTEFSKPLVFGTNGIYFYILNTATKKFERRETGKERTLGLKPSSVVPIMGPDQMEGEPVDYVIFVFKDKNDVVYQFHYDLRQEVVSSVDF